MTLVRGQIISWEWKYQKPGTTFVFNKIGQHEAAVTCILFHPKHNILFSGSIDNSIKGWFETLEWLFLLLLFEYFVFFFFEQQAWDIFGVYGTGRSCMQTLVEHNKTVSSIVYHQDLLISGSSDGTVIVWKNEDGRAMLGMHPWFVKLKMLSGFGG